MTIVEVQRGVWADLPLSAKYFFDRPEALLKYGLTSHDWHGASQDHPVPQARLGIQLAIYLYRL
jgi:hypothetical protein